MAKNQTFTMRMKDEDREMLDALAADVNRTAGDWVRNQIRVEYEKMKK